MGVYSEREGYFLGRSHIVVKNGGIFWEGGVDSGRVTNSCRKRGYIMGGRGRL